MRKTFDIETLRNSACAHLNKHLFPDTGKMVKKKRNKYNAVKTEVDGINFDSTKEAKRYKELKLLLKVGEIGMLERQVEYELNPGGTYSYKYRSDFEYIITKTGEKVVEDCKGCKTREYKKKRWLMKKVHGIIIYET